MRRDGGLRGKEEEREHWRLIYDLHEIYPKMPVESRIRERLMRMRKREESESTGRKPVKVLPTQVFIQRLKPQAQGLLKGERMEMTLPTANSREDALMTIRLLRERRWQCQSLLPAQQVLCSAIAHLEPAECLKLLVEHGANLFMIDAETIKLACEAILKRLKLPIKVEESAFSDQRGEAQRLLWDWARLSLSLLELSLPEATDYAVAIPAIKAVLQQVRDTIDPTWEIPKVRPKKTASALLDEALALK